MIEAKRAKQRLFTFAAAVWLFFWAPVSAEYLYGYMDSTGNPSQLFLGLLVLGPLYGAPALLIREYAIRSGRGSKSIALLASAFGFFQAGVVDNSLFNLSNGGYDEVSEMGNPTFVLALGISAYNMLVFVGNHVIFSMCAPIAITEGVFSSLASRKWLNGFSVALLLFLYAAASWLVHQDVFETNQFLPSSKQFAVCVAVVLFLCMAVLFLPHTQTRELRTVLSAPWMALIGFSG